MRFQLTVFLSQATIVDDIFYKRIAPLHRSFQFYRPVIVSIYPKITLIGTLTYIIKNTKTSNLNFKPPWTLKNSRFYVLTRNNFLIYSYFLMEIYITSLQQILSFSSRFRQFEMKNFLRRPTMVADNI